MCVSVRERACVRVCVLYVCVCVCVSVLTCRLLNLPSGSICPSSNNTCPLSFKKCIDSTRTVRSGCPLASTLRTLSHLDCCTGRQGKTHTPRSVSALLPSAFAMRCACASAPCSLPPSHVSGAAALGCNAHCDVACSALRVVATVHTASCARGATPVFLPGASC